ncbi:Myb-like DNA-binding domain containing protein [Histomonas meleagridis]|uniref:Myb-like DNA-binding domain containing protein n=1 Tax=Histomonas meleagridis TaxID=135588 RepID=UPI00355A1394|nr:Myb-like DNA-binding domain containing protein [Histomonas meleagridis]KAH0807108.1 Myb-like DNA-binding domain containing protein [Histomonas meleagridis]
MREAINIHGKDWKKVSKMVKTRNSKQCREHWKNTLDPSINKGPWTDEEDNILTEMLKTNPSGWSHIVPYLDHRTPLQARNRSIQLSSKKERKHIGASTLDSIELPSQYGFDLDDIYDGFNSF